MDYDFRDIAKASIYGRITFKMLVYPGKTKTIIDKDRGVKKCSILWFRCNITVCPVISDPFYIVSYYVKWVTTSWTYGRTEFFKITEVSISNETNTPEWKLICIFRMFISSVIQKKYAAIKMIWSLQLHAQLEKFVIF